MNITRENLTQLCDKFLNNEITKIEIKSFASTLMFSDELNWDDEDEILSDTIFEWDNEETNYVINKANMQLWKKKTSKTKGIKFVLRSENTLVVKDFIM